MTAEFQDSCAQKPAHLLEVSDVGAAEYLAALNRQRKCRQSWRRRPASSHTTMKTTAAIRPVIMNVLSIPENQPMAVKMNHTARIAPRIFPIIRPMCL